MDEYDLFLQGMHDHAANEDDYLMGQLLHITDPVEFVYVPVKHDKQLNPTAYEYVPLAQGVHHVLSLDDSDSTGHFEHDVNPVEFK